MVRGGASYRRQRAAPGACQRLSMISRSARCRFATMFRPADGFVARSARYSRGCILPQAARRSRRLPAVKHDSAPRAVSLRDDVLHYRIDCGASRALWQGGILPQAARRSGRLPAVKHDSALRAVSLRDGMITVRQFVECFQYGILSRD